MATKKIRVKPRGDGFVILPPVQNFKSGNATSDVLEFVNKSGEPVLLSLPPACLDNAGDANKIVPVGGTVNINLSKTADDSFEYQVYLINSRKAAVGNSDPVLIIDN